MKSMSTTAFRLLAAVAALLLTVVIAGCSAGGAASGDAAKTDAARTKKITLALWPGANDYATAMYTVKSVLEDNGYTVDVKQLADPAIFFLAAAKGEVDLFVGQPEKLHQKLWESHKDKLEDLVSWYDNSRTFVAVPDYVSADLKSIEDLAAHKAELEGKIFGIGQGTGLNSVVKNTVLPGYGLDKDFALQESSVTGMVTALKTAVDAKKPIAVTTWTPYWANSVFKLRLLEDPKNLMGGAEGIHVLARAGFSSDFPDVAAMISALEVTDEQLADADNMIVNEYGAGKEEEAVNAWLQKYPDIKSTLQEKLTS